MPLIKTGRLRLIAVTTAKRWPLLPGVPTISESGVPGYEHLIWNGLAVKTGTPKEAFDRVYAALMEILKSPELARRLAHDSALPSPETPEAFMQFLQKEQKKWRPVIKQAGISAR
jgi:tripartite-type tricarboxylate transporter receptor subunit TctC